MDKKIKKVSPMALPPVPNLPKVGQQSSTDAAVPNQSKLEVRLDDLRKERIFIATPCMVDN